MEFTKEQRNQALRKLPQAVQDAILSVELFDLFNELTEKQGLHIDQAGIVGDEVNLAMLGLIPQTELPTRLKKRLNLPEEKINALVNGINETIFQKIRSALKETLATQTPPRQPIQTKSINTAAPSMPVQKPPTQPFSLTERPPTTTPPTPSQPLTKPAQTLPPQPAVPPRPPVAMPTPKAPVATPTNLPSSPATLARDHLLKAIETASIPKEIPKPVVPPVEKLMTPPTNLPTGNFAANKLAGMFNVPHEETKVAPPASAAPTAPITKQYGADPYREPFEK